ncbi:carbohydrate ABC transporter permease [Paenibacillus sp. FSL H7-0331]|jgi:oligogalacturonide transport system permease protein|uniref:carbohydrate ABC transporter permease n=1 Tax=Paenibacillus sp. FSL H7-0331 TaxID=1920421 RepID=UPI00096F3910|nr:carbohydrate ABC transporter permease [Paenibacillus sp. FSL H7-0331]OMF15685.1 sugar ABC transporter permease [Paenibacillus sp. FSL H7-0331]
MKSESVRNSITFLLMCIFGLIMIYPLIWLFTASFKSNEEIFGSLSLWPNQFLWDGYTKGWVGSGQYSFSLFFMNTFKLVIPTVIFTVISSTIVAYGFARFNFPLKKLLFSLMISTLMLPNAVVIIPKYILFKNLGWLNSYLPFIVPAMLATSAFFIFMIIQFFRGLPRELDESAKMDGCNSFVILVRILLPLAMPALISAAIFQFIWTWNDFFNSLIYITSVKNFTVALGLRMALDNSTSVAWNQVLAMSVVAVVPCILVFFFAQKYFVEGISTTGIKG